MLRDEGQVALDLFEAFFLLRGGYVADLSLAAVKATWT